METTMELDELKSAWQALDRRLDAQNALNLHQFRESRYDRMRARLRWLTWWQACVLAVGIACTISGGSFWFDHRQTPHLLAAGLTMHVYGIAVIAVVARTLFLISQIDYAAPVLTIQQQLAALRRHYLRTGWYIGMPWLLIWPPFDMMICAWFGFDLYAHVPLLITIGLGSGCVGLLLVYAAVFWIPWPAWIARSLESRSASLDGADGFLEEIARFEQP